MAINYITAAEPIVGEGSAYFPDSKNRVGRQLKAAILAEHDSTGAHLSPYAVFPQVLYATYAGTGAVQTITLGIADSVTIKAVFIWSASYGSVYFRTDTMTKTKDVNGGVFYTGAITAFAENSFVLGTETSVNANGVTYYYAALVTAGWTDAGSNASPPSWIQHNVPMLGGANTTMANSVEKNLYEDKFEIEHSEAGVHVPATFAGISKVETGTLTVDGTSAQVVSLDDQDMDVKIFMVWADDSAPAYLQTETMAKIKPLNNTVLTNTGFLALGTGEVTINGTILLDEETVLDIPDGVNGTNTFTDASAYAIPLVDSGYSFIQWSNTYFQAGTTSLKISGGRIVSYDPLVTQALTLTNDFNIEFYFRNDNVTLYQTTMFYIGGGGVTLTVNLATTVITATLGSTTVTTTTAVNDQAWHKINVKRLDSLFFVEIDSVAEGAAAIVTTPIIPTALVIGYASGISFPQWTYIDEVIVKRTPALFANGQVYHYLALGV